LIDEGCTAIAVVARFPEDDEESESETEAEEGNSASSKVDTGSLFAAYRQGLGIDAIAGAEALISHIITKSLAVPCAHAPAFDPIDVGECQIFINIYLSIWL
jgi:hypothetical protein